jgi:hypothetical protein
MGLLIHKPQRFLWSDIMNTRHCQTCRFWDNSQRLERTNFGDLAPCTRSAPSHYSVASVLLRWTSRMGRQPTRSDLEP